MGLTFAENAIPEWEGKRAFALATSGQVLILDCVGSGLIILFGTV
jgi:hypothetical protein